MARILVNTRLLLPGRLGGIGWFTHQSLKRIVRDHPEHEFLLLFDRRPDPIFQYASNVQLISAGPQARHPVLFKIWFDYVVPRVVRKYKPDLFLSPDGYLSLRTTLPSIAVIHDLNFEAFPKDLPRFSSWHYRRYFPKYAHTAARIATVSEFSKTDLIQRYGIPSERIDVVYNGLHQAFHPLDVAEKQASRKRFGSDHPYIVYVGAQTPRKNLQRLFTAFDRFVTNSGLPHRLVLVGEKMFWSAEMSRAFSAMKHKSRVLFTGRLESTDLNEAVGGADAMAFVSYYEGFGVPLIEAFAAGVPVVAGNLTSLPEIAGGAAILVNPFDIDAIAQGLEDAVRNDSLRAKKIAAGLARAQDFTWERTADLLWRTIAEVLYSARH